VEQALTDDEPVFPEISDDLVDSAATTYADSVPQDVVVELATRGSELGHVAGSAGIDTWSRGLTIGEFRSNVRQLVEHALHDSLHHLGDVERGLAKIRSKREL
jgi:hypothetical protein